MIRISHGGVMAFRCEYMQGCPMYNLLTSSVRIMQLQPYLASYCTNADGYTACARFKIIATGVEPDGRLLPDGKRLKN